MAIFKKGHRSDLCTCYIQNLTISKKKLIVYMELGIYWQSS